MLDDVRELFGGKLSYTQIVVMGLESLYEVAKQVRKLTNDPNERVVLFEWVRSTRDTMCEYDIKWNLNVLREAWESFRRDDYKEQICRAAEFLKQGRHLDTIQTSSRAKETLMEEQIDEEMPNRANR